MKDRTVKVILVQSVDWAKDPQNGKSFRIAKLVGAVKVSTWTPGSRNTGMNEKDFYVGDTLTEVQARDIASAKAYEVTVTEKAA